MNEDNEIEVNLTEEEYDNLALMYAQTYFSQESVDQFNKTLETTGSVKDALYRGAINEMVNVMLARFIDELKDNPDMLAEVQAMAEQHNKENHEQS